MTTLYFKILKGNDEPEYRRVNINKENDTCDIEILNEIHMGAIMPYGAPHKLTAVSLTDWQKYAAISFIQGASAGFGHYVKHAQFKQREYVTKGIRKLPGYAIIDDLDGFDTSIPSLPERIADMRLSKGPHNDKVDAISYYYGMALRKPTETIATVKVTDL